MCMITFLPPNVEVPYGGILNGADWNDDGHGWAIAASTGLMVTGHSMSAGMALGQFMEARERFPYAYAMFHSRFATHGETSTRNCHPFYVTGKNKNVVVAHNGILPSSFHPFDKDWRSDTRIFASEWLAGQTRDGTWTELELWRIGQLIGNANKLAILSVSPRLEEPRGFLVNEDAGIWEDGAWFSNTAYAGYSRSYSNGWWSSNRSTKDLEKTATKILVGSKSGNKLSGKVTKCDLCNTYGSVDLASNTCTNCDSCLDCWMPLKDCMCYYPDSVSLEKKNTETVELPGVSPFPELSPVQSKLKEMEGKGTKS